MIFLVDMDGVLTDFVDAACRVHGTTFMQLAAKWPNGDYNIANILGLRPFEFWEGIDKAGEDFWINLRPTDIKTELLYLLGNNDKYIATSPSMNPVCASGKMKWIIENGFSRHFVITPHKHLMANRDTILIDDADRNVDKFTKAGGHGVLVPRRWNSLYRYEDNPMPIVKEQLFDAGYCG